MSRDGKLKYEKMTNTMILGGMHKKDDIIFSVDRGLYAACLGGGQVDISSGHFVFEVSEGYLIEKGKIGSPVKGATLIGNGLQVLENLLMNVLTKRKPFLILNF